jgi:hypothetical protein
MLSPPMAQAPILTTDASIPDFPIFMVRMDKLPVLAERLIIPLFFGVRPLPALPWVRLKVEENVPAKAFAFPSPAKR